MHMKGVLQAVDHGGQRYCFEERIFTRYVMCSHAARDTRVEWQYILVADSVLFRQGNRLCLVLGPICDSTAKLMP